MIVLVRSSKQCGSGYINTVRCLPTKSCACLAYHNEQAFLSQWNTSTIHIHRWWKLFDVFANYSGMPWFRSIHVSSMYFIFYIAHKDEWLFTLSFSFLHFNLPPTTKTTIHPLSTYSALLTPQPPHQPDNSANQPANSSSHKLKIHPPKTRRKIFFYVLGSVFPPQTI